MCMDKVSTHNSLKQISEQFLTVHEAMIFIIAYPSMCWAVLKEHKCNNMLL